MDLKFVQNIVSSLIKSIENSSIAVVRSLKETITTHTYKVEVKDPVKDVTVKGGVKVLNQKDVEKQLISLIKQVKALETSLAPRKKIMVDNFPKFPEFPKFPDFPKIPEYPTSTEVNNLNVIVNAVGELEKAIGKLKLDPKINVAAPVIPETVVNVPKVSPPIVNVEKPDLSQIKKLLEYFESLDAKHPLAVRLSDGKAFYKAIDRLAEVYTANNSSDFQNATGGEARPIVNRNNELQITISETWDINDSSDPDEGTSYIGEESVDGAWRIRKIIRTDVLATTRYATGRNNTGVSGYSNAWTNRLTLIYGRVGEAL